MLKSQVKEKSNTWKGGRIKDGAGYIKIYVDTPNEIRLGATNKYLPEHDILISKLLGRPLFKEETVHHKNGIRYDNRIANLELFTSRHGGGQRVVDRVKDARELLALYGDPEEQALYSNL